MLNEVTIITREYLGCHLIRFIISLIGYRSGISSMANLLRGTKAKGNGGHGLFGLLVIPGLWLLKVKMISSNIAGY